MHAATGAIQLNFDGIQGLTLRPIEAQLAVNSPEDARRQYIRAVIDYDRAQSKLLRYLGQPPAVP